MNVNKNGRHANCEIWVLCTKRQGKFRYLAGER
jgi:hypothetical protein